jgi:hypothetical protein
MTNVPLQKEKTTNRHVSFKKIPFLIIMTILKVNIAYLFFFQDEYERSDGHRDDHRDYDHTAEQQLIISWWYDGRQQQQQ